jgi:hypothetical protein
MSDWTYEPLILKLKAALAEVESEAEPKTPSARTAPRSVASAKDREDKGPGPSSLSPARGA